MARSPDLRSQVARSPQVARPSPVARFFYALRPDARAAAALGHLAAGLAARLGGRPLDAHDIHLTLVFVGERPFGDAPMLASLMTGLASPAQPLAAAESLAMARLGSFGRGLLWAGPAAAPPDWPSALAIALQQRLRAAGIGFDERALRLHATLVRGARNRQARAPTDPAPAAMSALHTAFDEFAPTLPIVPTGWTLALGRSGGDSTPQRRYHWRKAQARPPASGT